MNAPLFGGWGTEIHPISLVPHPFPVLGYFRGNSRPLKTFPLIHCLLYFSFYCQRQSPLTLWGGRSAVGVRKCPGLLFWVVLLSLLPNLPFRVHPEDFKPELNPVRGYWPPSSLISGLVWKVLTCKSGCDRNPCPLSPCHTQSAHSQLRGNESPKSLPPFLPFLPEEIDVAFPHGLVDAARTQEALTVQRWGCWAGVCAPHNEKEVALIYFPMYLHRSWDLKPLYK